MEEQLEGYVVDIACLRKYASGEVQSRARAHTRSCLLMGHCVESGYGLVGGDGTVTLLDTQATPLVVGAVKTCPSEDRIHLTVHRRRKDGEMVSCDVRLAGVPSEEPPAAR